MELTPPFVWLEDRLGATPHGLLFERPIAILRCDAPDKIAETFDRLDAALAEGLHAAGVFAYDLGLALEPRLMRFAAPAPHLHPAHPGECRDPDRMAPRSEGSPDHELDVELYDLGPGLRRDERKKEALTSPLIHVGLFPPPRRIEGAQADVYFAALPPPPPLALDPPGHTRAAHVAKVERLLALIADGDIYQANLTFPLPFRLEGDPLRLYAALRARQPTAHGGVAMLGDGAVLSISPELFVHVDGREATSRPMKGTAARQPDPAADTRAAQTLAASAKDRAENLMIVDLVRNDLARVAEPGSVRAAPLFAVETYPSFHALTSTVRARLRPEVGARELLAALFPFGSIVGAPKIRAAEVLAELEDAPRGLYTGALGRLAPDGGVALNVAIRTAVIGADGRGVYGVGGGIVADSDPNAEYDEALLKGRVLSDLARPYDLIETFGWSQARGYVRLAAHLDRLATSASALGFAFDRAEANARLAQAAAGFRATPHARRIRLGVARDGALTLADAPAPISQAGPLRLWIAHERLDAGDPFNRHKTTRRDTYDRAEAEAHTAHADEAILLNRSGHVADAARRTLFVERAGRLLTPPLTAGALPGVLRASLIVEGRAIEAELTLEDLAEAEAIYVGNSLRGLQRATLA